MMTCEEFLQYLSDYLDHDLDDELTAEARLHLETCQNCQIVLDSTRKAILLCKHAARREIPVDRRSRLFEQIQSALGRNEGRRANL